MLARDVIQPDNAAQYARSLIEASLDPLVAINPDGKIIDVNEATVRVTGADREQLIGTDFSDYFTEPEQARSAYRQVLADGPVADRPMTIRHKNGRLAEVLYSVSTYKDARGSTLGLFAAARDVTEARSADQRFRAFIRSAPDAVILATRNDGTILLVNNQTERLFGYKRDQLLGQPVEVLVPARFRPARTLRTGRNSSRDPVLRPMGQGLDLWGARKDGSEFPVEISLSPIESPRGLTVGATIRDVTVQKTASQYARSLIEASLDPLVTISPEGKITDVNEATVKVTGVPRDKLVGTDFSDYFTEPERAREGYREVFAMGSVTNYPLTIRHRNHGLTEVLYNASVYKDVRGNVLGVFAGARDMTAQKRAEAEVAEQRNKELERLAELERFQRLTVGRELKMIELKKEIADLKRSQVKAAAEQRRGMTGMRASPGHHAGGRRSGGHARLHERDAEYPR